MSRRIYNNLLTTHDVAQASVWRRLAPSVDEEAFQAAYRMIFVIGCGRSGTTIFSRCIGQHPDIAELNEPQHIWFATSAKADIVSPFAGLVQGRCRLDRGHVTEKVKARYRAMVDYHVRGAAPIICDKLPLNTFRVDYVAALCPKAKFILLQRSPREVARSIEQCVQRDGTWWGFNDYKWRAICRYAADHPELSTLIPYAKDDYYRGLIEWRVSQQLAKDDLSSLEPDRHMEVSYEEFTADPRNVLQKVFEFGEVPFDASVSAFAAAHVAPPSTNSHSLRSSPEDDRLHAKILDGHLH